MLGRLPEFSPAAIIARKIGGKLGSSRRIASASGRPSITPAWTLARIARARGFSVWRLIVRRVSSSGETVISEASWRVNSESCFDVSRGANSAIPLVVTAARVALAAASGPSRTTCHWREVNRSRACASPAASIAPRRSAPLGSIAR